MAAQLRNEQLTYELSELNAQKDDLRKQIHNADHLKSNIHKTKIEVLNYKQSQGFTITHFGDVREAAHTRDTFVSRHIAIVYKPTYQGRFAVSKGVWCHATNVFLFFFIGEL